MINLHFTLAGAHYHGWPLFMIYSIWSCNLFELIFGIHSVAWFWRYKRPFQATCIHELRLEKISWSLSTLSKTGVYTRRMAWTMWPPAMRRIPCSPRRLVLRPKPGGCWSLRLSRQRAPSQQRWAHSPADDPSFASILDQPPVLVNSSGKRHGPGLIVLGMEN